MKRKDFLPAPVSLWSVVFIIVGGILTAGSVQAAPPARPLLAACVVNNTNDSGSGSLRQCLMNAQNGNTITFNPSVFPPGSPATIALTSALPEITQGNLTIDGTGAGVILNGSAVGAGNGFAIRSNGNTIRGLQILNFPFPGDGVNIRQGASDNLIANNVISGNGNYGVSISDSGTQSNQVVGNRIGTNSGGTAAQSNGSFGVMISNSAENNIIGGDTPEERNIISGNNSDGVWLANSGTNNNTVSGNYIGTNINGSTAIPNNGFGVHIRSGAQNNTIGGDTTGERNIISGNISDGVAIIGSGTNNNTVSGNYIGTDANGTAAIPNKLGITIFEGAQHNTIGGTTPGQRNIISGNTHPDFAAGVMIGDPGTDYNTVIGNYIGTNVSGAVALGNGGPDGGSGVDISSGSTRNIIGGDTPGERNLISGNSGVGVSLFNTSFNTVSGNYIGTDVSGASALPNTEHGVRVANGSPHNIIGGVNASPGGACSGQCNLISGNGNSGVTLENIGTENNVVSGNYIGLNVNGTAAIPNSNGVDIFDAASNNSIGGDTAGERNLISGNASNGVDISHFGTVNNTVSGNYIGTNVNGTTIIANDNVGIKIDDGVQFNLIGGINASPGGACSGQCNLISGNGFFGVRLGDSDNNIVRGNYIGTDVSGTVDLGNALDGIHLAASNGNIIGGTAPGSGNLIAFNGDHGIMILPGVRNTIRSNSMFANGNLGIDLDGNGVTLNDLSDGDAGSNNLQNFPVLTSAETGGSDTLINVTFNSRPNTAYTFEFFANNTCDSSNYGEGTTFLTTATRTTASSGDISFTVVSLITVPVGQFITATATDPNGNTSEFSQCVLVQAQALDGQVGTSGGTVVDTAGTGAAFNVPPTVLPEKTDIFVQVISEPEILPPSGFVGVATALVNITLEPNPSPLPAPGATIILPLNIPLAPGISVPLFKYDSTTNTLINTGKVGTVNPGGVTATFSGVTDFSIFTGLSNIKKIYLPIIVK